MKTILVPVDFSDNSKNALDYAILLANSLKMKLLLIHAAHPSIEGIKNVKEDLELWREAINSSADEPECNAIYTKEKLADEVVKLVKENQADIIVMGTKGATGLKEIFMGSNTAAVIEKVSCPVIAVPEEYRFSEIKKIVFATDYHDSDVPSIRFMVNLSKSLGAELSVVHVADEKRKIRLEEDLLAYFKEQVEKSIVYDKMKFHLLEGDNVNKELNEFIDRQRADMLAVSAEEKMIIGPLFNRGLTRKFVHHIQIPLFVFHAYDIGENELF